MLTLHAAMLQLALPHYITMSPLPVSLPLLAYEAISAIYLDSSVVGCEAYRMACLAYIAASS